MAILSSTTVVSSKTGMVSTGQPAKPGNDVAMASGASPFRQASHIDVVSDLRRTLKSTGAANCHPADILQRAQDPDEVFMEVMPLLPYESHDEAPRPIKNLFVMLKDDQTCRQTEIRGPNDFPARAIAIEVVESEKIVKAFIEAGLNLLKG